MFTIEMLPAERGDALWLTYGSHTKRHHVLIDAGPFETIPTLVPELETRIAALPGKTNRVELFVITHIDADHIQGAVSLLSDHRRVPLFRDIWFNGFKHHGLLGGRDAERLTTPLLEYPDRWNHAFGGAAVKIPAEDSLPTIKLVGGMKITVLAPSADALRRLVPEWEQACEKAGITKGAGEPTMPKAWRRDGLLGFDPALLSQTKFTADRSRPNGASIALIAEYDGKRVLLAGDTPAKAILAGFDRLKKPVQRFDAVKVSHHGSRANTSLEMCQRITSDKWLISTNGAKFDHPNPECLARIVVSQNEPAFYFNYNTKHIASVVAAAGRSYSVHLPAKAADGTDSEGIVVSL
jgi:hypothetical protein